MGTLASTIDAADEGFANDNMAWLSEAINIGVHLFLVGAFIAFAIALVRFVYNTDDPKDRFGRSLALFLGALIVVGAQAMGVGYADFIIDSLAESRSAGFRFFGAVLPAAAGLALGYYVTSGMKRTTERTLRAMIAIGTLCVTQFALMYAIALDDRRGEELGREVTPNVAFVVGLALVMMLNWGVNDSKPRYGVLGAGANRFRDTVASRGNKKSKVPLVNPLLHPRDSDDLKGS